MAAGSSPHFFGRRKGKTLRQRQTALIEELLPQLRVNLSHLAEVGGAEACSDLWLEIGFGGGEHLASDALLRPDVCFIGCEPFVNGVAKLLSAISEKNISNVRIHDGDALEVLKKLPPASVGRINILYPDPWPKFRQRKRRFISDESLDLMASVLKDGGQLRFATDIDDYSAWTLARVTASKRFEWTATGSSDWKTPWAHWPGTRYEAKAVREGRTPAYFTFTRKPREPG